MWGAAGGVTMRRAVIDGARVSPINIEVTAGGNVSNRARAEARKKLDRLEGFSKEPVLGARVVLIQEPNPRIPLPARAEAEINLQGRLVRARAAASSMEAAVDDVAERLQRQLRQIRRPSPHLRARAHDASAR